MERLDGTKIPDEEATKFKKLVKSNQWIFAKTYADFCPHQYTLRKRWSNDSDYRWFAEFIFANGFDALYGNQGYKRYFIDNDNGWYYFLYPEDIDENGKSARCNTLINRGSLLQWQLVKEQNLFGENYRWKLLPKSLRRNPYENILER